MNTVMIASGDVFRARYIQQILETKYRVISASREGEVVERLAQGTLDLLILDSQLEVGESVSVLQRMRAARNLLPVIMLVQSIQSSPARRAEELGAFRILKIPFEDGELVYWVGRAMAESGRQQREIPAPPGGFPSPAHYPELPERAPADQGYPPQYFARILEKCSDALLGFPRLPELLETLVEIVRRAFDVRKVSLLIYRPETGKFAVEESSWMDSILAKDFLLQHEKGLAAWMSRNQRILRRDELEGGYNSPDTWEVKRDLEHLQAVMAIPLLTEGKLIGLVACGEKFTGDRFTRDDLALFSILSTFFARAIRQALSFRDISRREETGRALLEAVPAGVAAVDGAGLILSINRAARRRLALREDTLAGRPVEILGEVPAGLVRRCLETRRPADSLRYLEPVNRRPLNLSAFPPAGDHPPPVRAILLIREVESVEDIPREEERISESGR